jgi:hypothetical protein
MCRYDMLGMNDLICMHAVLLLALFSTLLAGPLGTRFREPRALMVMEGAP